MTQDIQKSDIWDEQCKDTVFAIFGIACFLTQIRTKSAFLILEGMGWSLAGGDNTVVLVDPGMSVRKTRVPDFSFSNMHGQAVCGGGGNDCVKSSLL